VELILNFIPTILPGAYVLEQTALRDDRGYFAREFCGREFGEWGLCTRFVQTNHSLSVRRGTIRGLHYQLPPSAEVKLFRCARGAVQDVMVDLRRGSPTFLRWHSEVLSEDNWKLVYVPAGFAHGCQALEDGSAITYQSSAYYSPAHERGVRYNDPLLGIKWQVSEVIVSPKDLAWPSLDAAFTGVALPGPADHDPEAGRASGRPRGQKKPSQRKRPHLGEVFTKLREAEADLANGLTVAQACRKIGVSEKTYQRWRDRYLGVLTENAERLKELEAENARLKGLVDELLLNKQSFQEVVARKG
jgi:dTDP-4-dehydrorhamnose 3,5-epimerase